MASSSPLSGRGRMWKNAAIAASASTSRLSYSSAVIPSAQRIARSGNLASFTASASGIERSHSENVTLLRSPISPCSSGEPYRSRSAICPSVSGDGYRTCPP